jgi:hypothetical protein
MQIITFTKIFQIFVKNKWIENAQYEAVLENFCVLLMNLNQEQRDLILELADRYSWISLNEYNSKLTNVLNRVENEKLANCKRIFVFPIMKPEDENKMKSGHSILYMIRGLKPLLQKYNKIEIIEYLKYEEISEEKFNPNENDLIFLVDDYLGSGETILSTLDKVMSNKNIKLNHLNVVTVAAQQDSIDLVANKSIPIYFDHIEKRGITDFYNQNEAEEKIKIMLEIEKYVIGGNFFSLGYNQSQALITLIRTPDNTFPIFWEEHKKNGEKFKAPFPRN